MTFPTRPKSLRYRLGTASLLLLASAGPARALDVQCGAAGEGDAFGWAVATGGDYDGDGVKDLAVGAPCAWVGADSQTGRVTIYSGATGRAVVSLTGSQTGERYGAALEFLADVNGDGKAELAIGAPLYNAPKENTGVRTSAGRVELRSAVQGGTVLWQAVGTNEFANLGESLAALADLDGDGKPDLAAGAGRGLTGQSRDGIAYVFSGATGALLGQNDGEINDESWGSVVGYAGDVDGDGTPDWLASANAASLPAEVLAGTAADAVTTTTTTTTTTSTTLLNQAGHVKVLSGKPPFDTITELFGADKAQRFGRAIVSPGDADGDQKSDLWIGSPGKTVGNQSEAGVVDLYSGLGVFVKRFKEPTPQAFADFGTSIAAPGSLDGGQGSDLVAGAPFANIGGKVEAGRVSAFDATSGNLLWSRTASLANSRFGMSMDAGIDFDGDGVGDVLVGSPGAAPNGRRGAGAAYVLSGSAAKAGQVVASFSGRRGRETRLFVAGPGLDRREVVRSFDPFGHRREAEARAFRGYPVSAASLAMLDTGSRASKSLLVVGAGKGGGSGNVQVYRAVRRRQRVSQFAGGPSGYAGSLNVAGGNLAADPGNDVLDEIAAGPADAAATNVDVAISQRLTTDPYGRISWTKVRQFTVFKPTDQVDTKPINAVGVNLVAGNVDPGGDPDLAELVVAPASGLPVMRIFSATGTLLAEKQVYAAEGPSVGTNSGVSLAIANLKGTGTRQILAAPARGQLWVTAWTYNAGKHRADAFSMTDGGPPVSFFVNQYGPVFEGGLTLAAADVDFDGADEIIVAPGPGVPGLILAFEADGTPVSGWATFEPYGPLATKGLSIVGTNDFWRP